MTTTTRLNVTLDEGAARKLAAMAERMHINEGTLARSLLTTAIDQSEPDPAKLVALLDGIPGAWQDAQDGWRQGITADTALRLARAFRTSEMFWLNLQTRHDLDVERDRLGDSLTRDIEPLTAA